MDRKINIFIIYTSDDNDIMLQLLRHLQPLKELHDISIWHDDPIYKGQLWKPQIESRLNAADIFLFLVSDAFMHSEFIDQSEFKGAIDRYKEGNAKVMPILIDKCPWDIDFRSDDYNFNFKELQVLPEHGKPIEDWTSSDEALDKITAAVASVIA
ncbi:MAG: toll/interleukin-1 receptor domain-containing protein, partial [Maribacter sp.]